MSGVKCNVDPIRALAIMADCPDISDQQDAALSELFPHYLFYSRSDHGIYCRCSGCNQHWTEPWLSQLETPETFPLKHGNSHNKLSRCPRCERMVTLKQDGITRNGDKLWQEIPVLFLLAAKDGGLYGRFALARKSYRHSRTPPITLEEKHRYYWKIPDAEYTKGTVLHLKNARHYNFEKDVVFQGWGVAKTCGEPWALEVGTYNYETKIQDYVVLGYDELAKSGLRYNSYKTLFPDREHGLCAWLGWYASGLPQLEMVARLGLRGIAEDLRERGCKNNRLLNWKAARPDHFLKLKPETAKACLRAGISSAAEVEFAQSMEREAMRTEQIAELLPFAKYGITKRICDAAHGCGVKPAKICRYLMEQGQMYPGGESAAVNAWVDYMEECLTIGLNLQSELVVMPRDLGAAHRATSSGVKNLTDEKLDAAYKENRLPELRKKYEFDDGELCILVPSGMRPIIGEGKRLKHCVGGYAERHVKGVKTVLFLRHSKQRAKSLVTVEMDGNAIMQIHGYDDERTACPENPERVNPRALYQEFLGRWLSWLKAGSPRDANGQPKVPKRKAAKEQAACAGRSA